MSHFTKVSTANIVSKESFVAACKELGYEDIKEGGTIRGWRGRTEKMDVAVTVPGSQYDFGIKRSADGKKFDLIAEDYLNKYEKPGILGRVIQLTTKHTIVSQYRKQGFVARVSVKEDQSLHVTLTR